MTILGTHYFVSVAAAERYYADYISEAFFGFISACLLAIALYLGGDGYNRRSIVRVGCGLILGIVAFWPLVIVLAGP